MAPTYPSTGDLRFQPGRFYSNGGYGRAWGVRQIVSVAEDPASGTTTLNYRGVAGTCRRKRGECVLADFMRWARYEVELHENEWKRVG